MALAILELTLKIRLASTQRSTCLGLGALGLKVYTTTARCEKKQFQITTVIDHELCRIFTETQFLIEKEQQVKDAQHQ